MHDDFTNIGIRHVWGGEQPFGLSRADRRQHLYAIGQTGTGKSTLVRNLILQDIEAGRGCGLIDPHGDLAEEILNFIPPSRIDHVVYFNPADHEFPIGFNLLQHVPKDERHVVASGIVSAFKHVWRDSWGPRMEYILSAAVSALMDVENASILGIPRLLIDDAYREWVVKQVTDPVVRNFWQKEYTAYDRRFRSEVIAPVQNKVGQLVMSPAIRNIVGQIRSKISPRFMMDRERIFIANLSKGRLGAETANLLGAFIVTEFQLAAMSRADIPEASRRDFFLYIDEFQNFSTDSFASILSEARKYRLCLTLSHQYIDQLRDEVRQAVFGNVANMISFRVGEADARILEREIGGGYSARYLGELANFHVCVRLLRDGERVQPFSGQTEKSAFEGHGRRETILRRSREKYATRLTVVEDKIRRWMK